MPKRNAPVVVEQNSLRAEEKIARAIAMYLYKDTADQEQKAVHLLGLGFSAAEITQMMGVSDNYVYNAVHRKTKRKTKSKAKKRR